MRWLVQVSNRMLDWAMRKEVKAADRYLRADLDRELRRELQRNRPRKPKVSPLTLKQHPDASRARLTMPVATDEKVLAQNLREIREMLAEQQSILDSLLKWEREKQRKQARGRGAPRRGPGLVVPG